MQTRKLQLRLVKPKSSNDALLNRGHVGPHVWIYVHISIIPFSQYLGLGASNLVQNKAEKGKGKGRRGGRKEYWMGISVENKSLKKFLWITLKRKSELGTEWLKQSKCSWPSLIKWQLFCPTQRKGQKCFAWQLEVNISAEFWSILNSYSSEYN